MLKIGVLGAGHLGKIHLKLLKELPVYTLIGFYDIDEENGQKVSQELQVPYFNNLETLLNLVDIVDIVTPTIFHCEHALQAINKGKHVFIEKPLTSTLSEGKLLVEAVAKMGIKSQVGHVERFNPAFLAVQDKINKPLFIEIHRLAQFNPRGTDVSVVLDLMIHDLDIVLKIVPSKVVKISANGVSIVSSSPDIANARIEFENGCVANITASRLSLKNMRKMRIFQSDAYISVDFLHKKSELVRLSHTPPLAEQPYFELPLTGSNNKYITFEQPEILKVNSIQMELNLFANSILHNAEEKVTVQDGYQAMELAYKIMDCM